MARSAAQRLLHTAVLLPVVLFAVSNLRFVSFLCSMSGDGISRADCCCPEAAAEAAQSPGEGEQASIQAAACCELRRLSVVRPPSEPPRLGPTVALALPTFTSWTLGLEPAPARAPAFSRPSSRPPPAGPALLLLKQTFLI